MWIHIVYWVLAGTGDQNAHHKDIDYESLPDLETAPYYLLSIQCALRAEISLCVKSFKNRPCGLGLKDILQT